MGIKGSLRALHEAANRRWWATGGAFATWWLIASCAGPQKETGFFPETCAEVQEKAVDETGGRPANGTYTLYVNGEEDMPWDAYCTDMHRAEPKEYLLVDETHNYSQNSDGNRIVVMGRFRRLRIDPIALEIDPNDVTYGDFETADSGVTDDELPPGYATYTSSTADGTLAAKAEIDLSGTPFSFDEYTSQTRFCINNVLPRADAGAGPDAGVGSDAGGGDAGSEWGDRSEVLVSNDLKNVKLTARNTQAFAKSVAAAGCSSDGDLDYPSLKLRAWELVYEGAGVSCNDGRRNGSESDTDCGGTCTTKCADFKHCATAADCQSNVCVASYCAPADAGLDASVDSGIGPDGGVDATVDSAADATLEVGPADSGFDVGIDAHPDATADASIADAGADVTALDAGPDTSHDASLDAGADAHDSAVDAVEAATDSGPDATPVPGAKIIFVTKTTYDGLLGGVSGADSKCEADANRPSGAGTYKAMLVDNYYRIACTQGNSACTTGQHVNWVLAPNTVYVRPDRTTIIGTTNAAGIFPFNAANLSASFGDSSTIFLSPFTALNPDWTGAPGSCSGTGFCDCLWFTTNASSQTTTTGLATSTSSNAISAQSVDCSTKHALYCVEQ